MGVTTLVIDYEAPAPEFGEREMMRLLANRTGDGSVHVRRALGQDLLRQAISGGLIDDEGFLTRKGRAFIARVGYN